MTYWNYRVIITNGEYAIHEVFYDKMGNIIACSQSPIELAAESMEELHNQLQWIKEALEDTPLTPDDLPIAPDTPPKVNDGISIDDLERQLGLSEISLVEV